LVDYTLDVPVDQLDSVGEAVVRMRLCDGSRRRTTFLVPGALLRDFDVPELLLYGSQDVILVTAISRDVIQRTLTHLSETGEIMDCSLPDGALGA
jgi:hypothetical protein